MCHCADDEKSHEEVGETLFGNAADGRGFLVDGGGWEGIEGGGCVDYGEGVDVIGAGVGVDGGLVGGRVVNAWWEDRTGRRGNYT